MKKLLSFLLVISYFFSFYVVKAEDSCKYEVISEKYDGNIYSISFTQDLTSYTFGLMKNDFNTILLKDGIQINKYKFGYTIPFQFSYSPDSKSYAYIAYNNEGKQLIVKDNKEIINNYSDIYSPLYYSPDSKSFSYIAKKEGKYIIVKDGKESEKYNEISNLLYSPDSKSFSYIVEKDGKYMVIKDGKESEKYNEISNLLYSPDSKSFLYIAKKEGKYIIVKDGKESEKYNYISNLLYTGDTDNYAYIINGKLFINGKKVDNGYDNISNLVYSFDGKSYAFEVVNDGEIIIVKDGKEIFNYKLNGVIVQILEYSPDGKSFTFNAQINNGKIGKYVIVKDGIESKLYDNIYGFKYSPDSKGYIFQAEDNGKNILIKDGIEIKNYDDILFPTYSSDGKRFSFIAEQDGKQFIVSQTCPGNNNSKSTETLQKQLKQSQKKLILNKDPKIKAYYTELNTILSKCNKTNLENILAKIQKLSSSTRNHPKYKDLFDYLEAKIMIELEK